MALRSFKHYLVDFNRVVKEEAFTRNYRIENEIYLQEGERLPKNEIIISKYNKINYPFFVLFTDSKVKNYRNRALKKAVFHNHIAYCSGLKKTNGRILLEWYVLFEHHSYIIEKHEEIRMRINVLLLRLYIEKFGSVENIPDDCRFMIMGVDTNNRMITASSCKISLKDWEVGRKAGKNIAHILNSYIELLD